MTYFKNICGNKKYKNKIDIRQYIYESNRKNYTEIK